MEISISLLLNSPHSNTHGSEKWHFIKKYIFLMQILFETKLGLLTGGCGQIGPSDLIQPPMKKCISADSMK